MKKTILVLMTLLMSLSIGIAQNNSTESNGILQLNPGLSYLMMEPTENLRKTSILLDQQRVNKFDKSRLFLGVSLISLLDYQQSNTDSKFGYLMRHPTSNNQIGKEVHEAVIHSFQLSATGFINPWLSFYSELLYNPEQSFGPGSITALGRNQIQLRKAFALFGNLEKFPLYAAIGKMDAPFAQTGSVSPFTNSTMWHAFGGLGYGAQIGFQKWNINATFMAVQGGSQFRAMNSVVGDSTNVPSKLNNFVADINYTVQLDPYCKVTLGASYLHGSTYCHEFPVFHFDPCKKNNPANAIYGRIDYRNRLVLKGGYTATKDVWPGTKSPYDPLDIFAASKVTSLDAGFKYICYKKRHWEYSVSGEFSNFRAGSSGAPWERQNQYVIGLSTQYKKSSKLFLEVFRTEGYVPLNWISGSLPNAPFPAGTTHSKRDAISHGIVLGGQLTL